MASGGKQAALSVRYAGSVTTKNRLTPDNCRLRHSQVAAGENRILCSRSGREEPSGSRATKTTALSQFIGLSPPSKEISFSIFYYNILPEKLHTISPLFSEISREDFHKRGWNPCATCKKRRKKREEGGVWIFYRAVYNLCPGRYNNHEPDRRGGRAAHGRPEEGADGAPQS